MGGGNKNTISSEEADQQEIQVKNYYALIAIFDDGNCIKNGELIVKIVIQDL